MEVQVNWQLLWNPNLSMRRTLEDFLAGKLDSIPEELETMIKDED